MEGLILGILWYTIAVIVALTTKFSLLRLLSNQAMSGMRALFSVDHNSLNASAYDSNSNSIINFVNTSCQRSSERLPDKQLFNFSA